MYKFIQLLKKNKKQCDSKKRKHLPFNVLVLPHKHHYKITLATVLQQPHVAHIGVACFFGSGACSDKAQHGQKRASRHVG